MTEAVPPQWTRATFETLPHRRLSRGSRLKPAVWHVDGPAGPVLVKDTAQLPAAGRWIGRWLLNREAGLMRRLAELPEVPDVLARIDRDALVYSLVPGEPLDRERFRVDPADLTSRLREIVRRMHARGVYHLDLHQRQNILVGAGGELHLVDFGAAVALGPFGRALLGPLLAWVDGQAVLKYLARFAPECLTRDEARQVLRFRRWRKLWILAPRHSRRERDAALHRLRDG
ncbi:MAG: hypothetical protein E2O39_14950 [Planctomycetota bacterium]|nr:MAG: hypothetical protein E2O39_14950 [Planctomycetota bacterium]